MKCIYVIAFGGAYGGVVTGFGYFTDKALAEQTCNEQNTKKPGFSFFVETIWPAE